MFSIFKLVGQNRSDLNTEMRFLFASAKVDGDIIVRLDLPLTDDEKENNRINGCAIKVLRTLKKEGVIQFYVNKESLLANSTEAIFLLNKFGEYISDDFSETSSVYVKL